MTKICHELSELHEKNRGCDVYCLGNSRLISGQDRVVPGEDSPNAPFQESLDVLAE